MRISIPQPIKDADILPPQREQLESEWKRLKENIVAASSVDDKVQAIEQWDRRRRQVSAWSSLASLRFYQDTTDDKANADKNLADTLDPVVTGLDKEIKHAILNDPLRPSLEKQWGSQIFALWDQDMRTFSPAVEELLVEESNLTSEYARLRSSAEIEFQGETMNLSQLGAFSSNPDRTLRREAALTQWDWYATHCDAFDDVFDRLVKLRTRIAIALGYPSYTELAYDRMHRTDYGPQEVARFRAQVREHILPLASKLRDEQRRRLGVEKLMVWDSGAYDQQGSPSPSGDREWMINAANQMFSDVHPSLQRFFAGMVDADLLDLDARKSKAGGGFCTAFADSGTPFVFANFNGTHHDASVFTHEMGHAYQVWSSREQPLVDYLWPTLEACEIHSMSLEHLCMPQIEQFFGDDADRYRQKHMADNLLFMPYACAIDEFQHEIYANPELSPDERRQLWRQLEISWLPERDNGGIPHLENGGAWHRQLHVFEVPFYYIDYALAETCALQLWHASTQDFPETIARYDKLCALGGSLPFTALCEAADLRSPFEVGCLDAASSEAARYLGLQ